MRSALSQWTDSKVRPGGEKVAYAQNREGSEAGNTPILPPAAMALPHLTTEPNWQELTASFILLARLQRVALCGRAF